MVKINNFKLIKLIYFERKLKEYFKIRTMFWIIFNNSIVVGNFESLIHKAL